MSISQKNMNAFWSDLITMVPEWNHFIFMQTDDYRWPPGAVTKNSTNKKMTISQEPLDEIDPTLCHYVFCMKLFWLFEWIYFIFMQTDYPKWSSGAVTKKSINTENEDISRTIGWNWSDFVPEYFLYEAVLIFAVWHSKMAAICCY